MRGNNTTISIAHRLSTIKRADQIIVLSPHGTVAEQGTYAALSADPESAFSRLMEAQLSSGDPAAMAPLVRKGGPPSEVEQVESVEMEEGEEGEEPVPARAVVVEEGKR